MTGKALAALALAVAGLVATCATLAGAVLGGSGAVATCTPPPTTTTASTSTAITASPPGDGRPSIGTWTPDQVANAATIINVGTRLAVPVRGWVIAIATAIQESSLTNLGDLGPANDHDSLGLFQQRPSQGWGTPAQLMDPTYAATEFYQALQRIPNWQSIPLDQAAQAVQRSAYPAYARWEPDAEQIVAVLGAPNGQCPPACPTLASSDTQPSPDPGCSDGQAILARAATWLTAWHGAAVPYLSSSDPTTWFGGYRRDCSGFASMALGLPGPGLDTSALAARSTPIPKAALHPGDLLINPAPNNAGHVVIFERWTNATMTSYLGYEQSGDGGTHHRVVPYPYFNDYPMIPYTL
jgi:hypothetical protein